jgi:hypothetical protein
MPSTEKARERSAPSWIIRTEHHRHQRLMDPSPSVSPCNTLNNLEKACYYYQEQTRSQTSFHDAQTVICGTKVETKSRDTNTAPHDTLS